MTDLTDQQPEQREPEPEQGAPEVSELPEPTLLRPGLPRRRSTTRKKKQADAGQAAEEQALALARRIVDLASDKKAADIVLLEIRELTTLADYFVIASGASERQLGAIADGIIEKLREEGMRPIGREGTSNAHWVLIDFGSVIVHLMAPPERDFYQLERLWADAPLLLRLQ
ncbi:MAG: ribosome silencing factor [Candidatus Limnocylindrales bacterium]